MQTRIENLSAVIPEGFSAIQSMIVASRTTALPSTLFDLVHLRTSQINACAPCIDGGSRQARKGGETDERLFSIAAWRETPYYTEAERAALALAESVTRLADRSDAVPDEVWDEAARHFDEKELASLLLWISTVNVFNRLNVSTRQPVRAWG